MLIVVIRTDRAVLFESARVAALRSEGVGTLRAYPLRELLMPVQGEPLREPIRCSVPVRGLRIASRTLRVCPHPLGFLV